MTTSNATNNTQKFYFSDLNDSQKQTLADQMLSDHPMRSNTCIVEYILGKSWEDEEAPFSWDDIINFEYYGSVEIKGSWEELTKDERDEKLALYEHLEARAGEVFEHLENKQLDEENDDLYDAIQVKVDHWEYKRDQYMDIVSELERMHFDQQPEIYQWFSCSDWLIRALEEKGECTLDGEFWGRQCCGQSVALDHVIQVIAFEYACNYNCNYLTADQVGDL